MAPNFLLVLGVLLCSGAVLTAKGQDVREDIRRLLQVAEDIDENVEDMEDEIEDFGDEIEDMKMDVDGVAAELHTVKQEVGSLQRDMNSTLYILQELKEQLINMRQENSIAHQRLVPGSCSELYPTSQSKYYWLRGLPKKVYCDMDRQSCGCGNPWGWMRVANVNMTDPNQQCPKGFRLRPGTSKRMCEMTREKGGCTSIVFPIHSVQYNRVCGRVQAYQYGEPEAFSYGGINRKYLDGVSITHGQSPRKHIWSFAAALDETRSDGSACPCTRTTAPYTGGIPSLVGNDYFCDTGSREHYELGRLYIDDPLWDGEGCGPTSSCCQFNSPPWFCKELPQPTTDDIEVRVCRSAARSDEDMPFDIIEMYVQ